MTKSYVHESFREEAERLGALEERGALDELPFTRLRRYAKEPSQVYAIRIPVSRLRAIRWLAERRKEQPTALLREWVLERLDEELTEAAPRRVQEDPSPYLVAGKPRRKATPVKRATAKGATKTPTRRAAAAKKR